MPYNTDANVEPTAAGNQFEHDAKSRSDTKEETAGIIGLTPAAMVNRDGEIPEIVKSLHVCM